MEPVDSVTRTPGLILHTALADASSVLPKDALWSHMGSFLKLCAQPIRVFAIHLLNLATLGPASSPPADCSHGSPTLLLLWVKCHTTVRNTSRT